MLWLRISRSFSSISSHKFLSRSIIRPVSTSSLENSKVEHSQFLASASSHSKWNDSTPGNGTTDAEDDELSGVKEGVGKLLPTSSNLFKLILPLVGRKDSNNSILPIVLLLHPSQPLSHVGRLILASLPRRGDSGPTISFRSIGASHFRQLEWSDSTDLGDFIRDAARVTEFNIHIMPSDTDSSEDKPERKDQVISVRVPTFTDRTRFLRRRLDAINGQLHSMEGLKRECDREARRGARRMAVGGFGLLVVYWAAVARLTFWDYGWDVMEPITYLSGLSTVICGYLWHVQIISRREVSYSSVLDQSVSARREALYKQRGLDIDKWGDLVSERKHLMKEIGQIKEDYEQPQREKERQNAVDDDDEVEVEKGKSPIHEPEEERLSDKDERR
ncbi:hypothetical protein D9757_000834 [Collybiopsis confluens]|uniref:Calcium uniporter protein, mitochondrial n=1 Tax=Collybiopsis confluens TaxID=2823264 RepID=A0A8H5I029_9AGAR|nr:hypothetical protein D9757_000834 [Collybiopsis confluens]